MVREVEAIETEYQGVKYRSRTEARWAVFLEHLGLNFNYENELVTLSSGEKYLPDFFIYDFDAYFEIKPSNENVVTEECTKARTLAKDEKNHSVWLAMGPPSSDQANILPLNLWDEKTTIGEILDMPENRYRLLEDRRDPRVYWLHSELIEGEFNHSYMVGGPGESTDHERLPLLHNTVLEAYEKAKCIKF